MRRFTKSVNVMMEPHVDEHIEKRESGYGYSVTVE